MFYCEIRGYITLQVFVEVLNSMRQVYYQLYIVYLTLLPLYIFFVDIDSTKIKHEVAWSDLFKILSLLYQNCLHLNIILKRIHLYKLNEVLRPKLLYSSVVGDELICSIKDKCYLCFSSFVCCEIVVRPLLDNVT